VIDIVVTVPMGFWPEWIEEGDAAGEPSTGEEWGFFMGGRRPPVEAGDRLYVVAHGRLRGFAPVTRLAHTDNGFAICREGGGVAVTIDETIKGFRGWRRRWWSRADERPFPDWMTANVPQKLHPNLGRGRRRLAG
jgi:hypothetical protein